jgi:large subunit ribosomal protein L3
VDVQGTSKGKGFQGVMKRWGFSGGFATHGNSVSHRVPGSTGMRQDPGRVFKNKKMAGRMGCDTITVQNLKVLKIDPFRQLLYVKGAVPGHNGNWVQIVDAVKGPFFPAKPPLPTAFDDDKVQKQLIWAPAGEKDRFDLKEPDDPY